MMKVQNTFFSRLSIAMVACFIFVGVSLIGLVQSSTQNHQREVKQRLHLDLAKQVVKFHPLLNDGQIDKVALKAAFHTMMVLGPGFEFYVIDLAGKIVAFSAEDGKIKRETVDLLPVKRFLSGDQLLPILGDDPRSAERRKIFSVAPVYDESGIKAYLYVIIGGEIYDDVVELFLQSHIFQLSLWTILSVLVFGLMVALMVFFWLTRPIRQLDEAMQKFKADQHTGGDLLLPLWKENSANEIHRLGHSFQTMAQTISQQIKTIKDNERQRTQMLSHISHDLRTPLASLRGYLETWKIKQEGNSQCESTEYIDIAIKNARQLNGLVEQIFELIHLESKRVRLNCEAVAIAELIQDVLQKFTLDIETKGIQIKALPTDSSLYVIADIEKLERVITNLVENAITVCEAGDTLSITLDRSDEQVKVCIEDTGCGILDEDIDQIFEPHFRGQNSKKSAKGNSGLGLAITKGLLALHDADIFVSSKMNVGTQFWFSLPVAKF